MMPGVARLGDSSTHGGTVITASPNIVADGIGFARQGDLHACPIDGHGVTSFNSGAIVTESGRGLVRAGIDSCGCGAVVVGGSPSVNVS